MHRQFTQTQQIYSYLERLANLLRAEAWRIGKTHGLQPIQLQMLDYLSLCNRYSNTPAAVADYFGLTKGTVSQSLQVLEEKGLVQKIIDPHDGRSVHLTVTPAGHTLCTTLFPPPLLQSLPISLSQAEQSQIVTALHQLLLTLQHTHQLKSFGLCASCRYHQVEGPERYRCGLTQEPLGPEEIDLICREHTLISPLATIG